MFFKEDNCDLTPTTDPCRQEILNEEFFLAETNDIHDKCKARNRKYREKIEVLCEELAEAKSEIISWRWRFHELQKDVENKLEYSYKH